MTKLLSFNLLSLIWNLKSHKEWWIFGQTDDLGSISLTDPSDTSVEVQCNY